MPLNRLLPAVLLLTLMAPPLAAQSGPEIKFRDKVTVNVGESVVIYGYRGECGALPADADIDLPSLKTGTLSTGRDGFRQSKRCNGKTPAVEIIFTATTPGREKFEIQGDGITVRVKD
jgi:hypothetical protein